MKILIVEDEAEMLNSITAYLAKAGYACEIAASYAEAEEKLALYQYDCILLDITLPDGNGLDLLTILRQHKSSTGVIILSAKNALDDRIKGLALGADDYLLKPFHLSELNARVQALLRRLQFEGSNQIGLGNLQVDILTRQVSVNEKMLVLTKKEYELLLFFVSNQTRVISKISLAEHIWGDNSDQNDSYDFLYSQIKNLRKKLAEAGAEHTIQAVYGFGYKLVKE
ncbi:MAG: response regulator transcription factor [Bacteroidota bacterium]